MRHACLRGSKASQLLIVEMDAVRIEHVAARPAERFHIGVGPHPGRFEGKPFFVLRFAKVRVETNAVLPGEHRALAQKIRSDREWRAWRKHHLPHGERGRVVVGLNEPRTVGENGVHVLYDGVRGQAAVLPGKAHAAA